MSPRPKLPKEVRQRINREVAADMKKQIAKERTFWKANPLQAAYWMMPGIGSYVHLAGATPEVAKKMARSFHEMPCPCWAVGEALATTRYIVAHEPAPPPEDSDACQAWRMMRLVAGIPDDFWKILFQHLPHKQKPKKKVKKKPGGQTP